MGKRKKVAVFVSSIYGTLNHDMQVGISKTAVERNVKVVFFASFSDGFSKDFYDQYDKYDEGDIVSFKIPNLEDFDGAVFVSSSFPVDYKKRIDKLLQDSNIPVINLGDLDERYYSIINNEPLSYSKIVEHLIEKHGCKDIYHVAGKTEYLFTHDRISICRSTMEKYGLSLPDDKIYYGTLWRDCGEPALDYILENCRKEGKKYPDAIVCANDYTAVGICDACRRRGIKVPDDIIVTGYDGIDTAFLGNPTITTSSQPFYEVARQSIYTLEKIWAGEKVDKVILSEGNLVLNQSCGCVPLTEDRSEEIRHTYAVRMGKMEYLSQSMTNMILSMSGADSLEDCLSEVEKNARIDTGFKDFVLCLAPDWDKQRVVDDSTVLSDEQMTVVAGFMGDKPVENQTFNLKELMPKEMMDDPNPYYIFSIHHLQYYMGYIIVSPELENFNQLIMKSWLVNLGSMLENWRVRNNYNNAIDRLENLYNRDMLTGLYNRRGYEKFFGDIFTSCMKNKCKVGVLVIDMDNLKYVNDNFGHSEGDYSLCTIAEAMVVASQDSEVCLRTGGDEFVVLAGDYNEQKAGDYIERVRKYIATRVKLDNKNYPLQVSVGSCIVEAVLDGDKNVSEISEEFMRRADAEMYKEKKEHKRLARERNGLNG